jgi:hypothetical protein
LACKNRGRGSDQRFARSEESIALNAVRSFATKEEHADQPEGACRRERQDAEELS